MNDSNDDFAAMFEASLKTKRFTEGQTIEGTIVAIGPEVAFVDVGGKGEATKYRRRAGTGRFGRARAVIEPDSDARPEP
jgi:hypothetical protein